MLSLFMVQLSHPYVTTGKTIALTRWIFVCKVMLCFLILCIRDEINTACNCHNSATRSIPLLYIFYWWEDRGFKMDGLEGQRERRTKQKPVESVSFHRNYLESVFVWALRLCTGTKAISNHFNTFSNKPVKWHLASPWGLNLLAW